ncbi:MAG TPA: hypothetical protein VNE42_06225 [Acidimicrobiales bacterium]|nr:hypothetical protein [Acidimicrobiales bacterium]
MAYSEAPSVGGDENFTKDVPVQRSTSGFERPEPEASNPTARQNVDAHETSVSPLCPLAGVATGTRTIVIEAAANLGLGFVVVV